MRTPRLDRDRQQWIFDYLVKETGRVFHWDADGRVFPASVKSHAQISKHVGRVGQRIERVAAEEEAAGHRMTAFELYYKASIQFAAAQHPVLETNDEKRYLHGRCLANYEKVIELAPYPIERVEIPFEGAELQCNFHLLKGRPKAPAVIFIPGCDMTKEMYPDPQVNHALDRGMHLLAMDGPGQGASNLRGNRLTADNYERAVIAEIAEENRAFCKARGLPANSREYTLCVLDLNQIRAKHVQRVLQLTLRHRRGAGDCREVQPYADAVLGARVAERAAGCAFPTAETGRPVVGLHRWADRYGSGIEHRGRDRRRSADACRDIIFFRSSGMSMSWMRRPVT